MPERPTPARAQRGYSLIELLIASAIATAGLYASLSLCMSALRGNTELRDANVGMYLAEHTLATVQAEAAVLWTSNPPANNSMRYLKHLGSYAKGTSTNWKLGHWNPFEPDKRVGNLGNDSFVWDKGALVEIPAQDAARYCIHWRLTWVNPDLARAEVRVSWTRPNVPVDQYKACPVTMVDDVGNVLSVTLPALVMRNLNV